MTNLLLNVGCILFLCVQIQQRCVFAQMLSTELPISPPILPMNPTLGGKPGNPGTILRLARKLFVNNVESACRDAEKSPDGKSLDDIAFPFPNGQIVVSQLRLVSLTLPVYLSDVKFPDSLCWCTEKGRLSAAGFWTYNRIVSSNSTVNYTGQVYVPPVSFTIHLNTSLGRNSENQPAINDVACRIKLDKTKMFFSTAIPQARSAINEIESNVTQLVSEALEDSMCDLISNVLQTSLNKFLSTFRTKIQISERVTLDYSLIADPFVDPIDRSISHLLKGSILVNGAPVPSIYPHDMGFVGNSTNRMIHTLFSDYMLNSLLLSTYQSNMFRLIIVDKSFSENVADYLELNCESDELCVGNVFPSMSSYPPNAYAELAVSVNQAPNVIFLESGAFLQVSGTVSIDIKVVDSVVKMNRYTSPFSLVAVLTPQIREDELNNVLYMDAKVTELRLTNAADGTSDRDKVITLLMPIMEEIVNKQLRRGTFPLPMFLNNKILKLRQHRLKFYNRTLLLCQYVQ